MKAITFEITGSFENRIRKALGMGFSINMTIQEKVKKENNVVTTLTISEDAPKEDYLNAIDAIDKVTGKYNFVKFKLLKPLYEYVFELNSKKKVDTDYNKVKGFVIIRHIGLQEDNITLDESKVRISDFVKATKTLVSRSFEVKYEDLKDKVLSMISYLEQMEFPPVSIKGNLFRLLNAHFVDLNGNDTSYYLVCNMNRNEYQLLAHTEIFDCDGIHNSIEIKTLFEVDLTGWEVEDICMEDWLEPLRILSLQG